MITMWLYGRHAEDGADQLSVTPNDHPPKVMLINGPITCYAGLGNPA